MPVNFGTLTPLQQEAKPLMGQAPQLSPMGGGDGDGGMGELAKGLGQLKGAFNPAPAAPSVGSSNLGNTFSTQDPGMQTSNPNPVNQPAGIGGAGPADLFKIAQSHLGQNEHENAPVLMSVLGKMNGQQIDPQTTPWCAGFVNGVLQAGGVKGSGSLAARSLLNWGTPTDKPSMGDIVVLNRGDDPNKGHTGFFAGMNDDGSIKVLGGNQGSRGEVSVESFSPNRVLGYRRPPSAQQVQQQIAPKDASPILPQVMQGIAHVESQGSNDPYSLKGKATRSGDQALGKYQIMASNVPSWTKEAIGKSVSPEEFLRNPALQEKVAAYHLNKSLAAGYSPQDTASIWFSGRPQNKAGNAKDGYGTTVPQYVNKFNEGMQGAGTKQAQNSSQPMEKYYNPAQQEPPQIPTQQLQNHLRHFDNGSDYGQAQPAMSQLPQMQGGGQLPQLAQATPQPYGGVQQALKKPIREMNPQEIQALMRSGSLSQGSIS